MIAYDDLIDQAVSWVQRQDWFDDALARIVLVRDLRGRVRLVVDRAHEASAETDFAQLLGGWAGGILWTSGQQAGESAIARQILADATPWPTRWPEQVSDGFGNSVTVDSRWLALERFSGKEPWLDTATGSAPWPLHERTPSIATFYSFKGGVGRTTALAITAAQLAERGQRVLCIDLDLEAPGLADAFGVEPRSGALDLLLEYHVNGRVDKQSIEDAVLRSRIGTSAEVTVLPAAVVNQSYIERVARLDYLPDTGTTDRSPVESGLVALLKQVKPDYDTILLDARAGIHDLGGLSMLSLSHASVVVFRPDRQALDGLELVLQAYASRRAEADRRLLMSMSFVAEDAEAREGQLERWRLRTFERCVAGGSIYADLSDPPELDDPDVPHDLVPLLESSQLSANENLQGHSASPVDLPGYSELADRLAALLAPETAS